MTEMIARIKYYLSSFFNTWVIGPICMGGLQNILVWLIAVMLVRAIYRAYKDKRLRTLKAVLAVFLLICCLFTMIGPLINIRLVVAFSGHPVIAFSTDSDRIETVSQERFYLDSEFRSGYTDRDGFKIAPLTIRTYRLLFFCYSRFIGNG